MSFTRSETATRNTVSMERQDTFHHLNEAAERAKQLARQDTKTMVLTRSQSITPGSDAATHATRRPSVEPLAPPRRARDVALPFASHALCERPNCFASEHENE